MISEQEDKRARAERAEILKESRVRVEDHAGFHSDLVSKIATHNLELIQKVEKKFEEGFPSKKTEFTICEEVVSKIGGVERKTNLRVDVREKRTIALGEVKYDPVGRQDETGSGKAASGSGKKGSSGRKAAAEKTKS